MPSSTFFNLTPEKRDKLIRAARNEFARAPYGETSINRIIQEAEIPRGSFYMYFADKEDLFLYVLGTHGRVLSLLAETLLDEARGDPFVALLVLYDQMCSDGQYQSDEVLQGLMSILRLNHRMYADLLVCAGAPESIVVRFTQRVDPRLLDLQKGQDLEDIVELLIRLTAVAIMSSARTEDPSLARAHLSNQFAILKRGMSAKLAHT